VRPNQLIGCGDGLSRDGGFVHEVTLSGLCP
jgi:hypothetical protein